MKCRVQILSISFCMVTLGFLLAARAQDSKGLPGQQPANAAPAQDPLKIALLHWYTANLTASFSVGNEPYGLAFDGANIWTANYAANTVTKLRANDGTVLGTFNVGHGP